MRADRSEQGVSLLEVMIAVVVIGILVAGASPHIQELIAGSRRGKALADLGQIAQSVTKFNFEIEGHLDRLEEIEGRTLANVRDLRDPWGNPYRLNTGELLVYSAGPNRRDERGRGDDIVRRYRIPPYMVKLNRRNIDTAPKRHGSPVPDPPGGVPPAGDAGALIGR